MPHWVRPAPRWQPRHHTRFLPGKSSRIIFDLTPASEGTLGVEVYDVAGAFVAWVPDILSASTTRRINQIASFDFTVSALNAGASALTAGRQVRIIREGEGEVFRGIIGNRHFEAVDGPTLTISGASMAEELVWLSTYLGIPVEDLTPAAAMALLLADATSWTDTDSVTGPLNVTDPFVNMSVWRALTRLAETQDGYVRETATAREVELKNTSAVSGVRLVNVEAAGPELLENADIGLITKLTKREEGGAIINRIVPFGVTVEDIPFDLGRSTRASPYTIANVTKNKPRIVHTLSASVGTSGTHLTFDGIKCVGQNRYLIVAICYAFGATGNVIDNLFNGKKMLLSGATTNDLTNQKIDVFTLVNPPGGIGTFQVTLGGALSSAATLLVVSLADVDLLNPEQDTAGTWGTGTAANTGNLQSFDEAESIGIGFITHQSGDETEGSGQALLVESGVNRASQKTVLADPGAMAWTLAPSQEWLCCALAIRGARAWYIEDTTSEGAYGTRSVMLQLKSQRFVGATAAQLEDAANTLYDIAAARLQRLKDPVAFYDVEVARMPTGWLVGDSVRLDYIGVAEVDGDPTAWLEVDEDIPVLERTEIYDADGVRRWQLKLAGVYRFPRTIEELITGQLAAVSDLESL